MNHSQQDPLFEVQLPLYRSRLGALLQRVMDIRVSEVLFCSQEVHDRFMGGPFTRADVIAAFYWVFNERTVDRALLQMEACGIIRCVQDPTGGRKGGAVYWVSPPSEWHEYSPAHVLQRAGRYHLNVLREQRKAR